ncbi:MAG: M16 family metallopeptidase [Vicinamibacterales bacterium]
MPARPAALVALVAVLAVPIGAAQPSPVAAPAGFRVPYEYFTLPNGLKVVVSPDDTAPVVLVEVMYNIGFRVEPKGRTGFAHLFEHMMFQGSTSLKKLEHIQLVSRAGGVLNGSTRFDYTNYYQVVPSNALELTLWLEADRMRGLDLTPENLKNQQNVVSEEVRVNVLNQPHGGFEWLDLWEHANTNWHNAHNFYGDLSELEAATLDDVRAFFRTYYAPNNAVLVVVGDTTAAEVKALAEKHFGSIPRGTPIPAADVSEPAQTSERRATRDDALARTPALAIGWHLPPRMSRDFFALAVLDPLLVGDQSARLHQALVRDTRQATAVAGAFNLLGTNWDMKGPMLFTLRVDYRPETTADKVVATVDEVLADIRERGVTATELASAKRALRSAFLEDLEGGGLPRFGRANLLAAFALFDDDPGRINTILTSLDAVTADEVKAAAGRWFVAANRTTLDSRPTTAPSAPGGAR